MTQHPWPLPDTTRTMICATLAGILALCGSIMSSNALAVESNALVSDLTDLSIEELMDIPVTLASKKTQKMSDVPAAMYVITSEDLKRSGVTSIPEALRMVPGVQVARLDKNKWAITARGFNDRFANKLLVLMDGRSVYTPLFSGVFWNMQDTLIEDIDRIEVIRGPGAAIWGANAVNGVINIITKNAWDTQGGLATVALGNEEQFAGVRYGAMRGDVAYRAYAKSTHQDEGIDLQGNDGDDGWQTVRGGFRIDADFSRTDSATLQGDIFAGEAHERIMLPDFTAPYWVTLDDRYHISGQNLLGRWQHVLSENSVVTVQAYLDHYKRTTAFLDTERGTFDLELHHQFSPFDAHEFVWGVGYRFTKDDIDPTPIAGLDPESRSDNLFSAFIQDDIQLVENRLTLTLGAKFEHNDYTGMEYQPNARLFWTPVEGHALWGAVSRAVRVPARIEHDGLIIERMIPPGTQFPGSPLIAIIGRGDEGYESEELLSYELGYRTLLSDRLTLDLAAYYNDYDDLRTLEEDTLTLETEPVPHIATLLATDNMMDGTSYGLETAVDWQPLEWWRLRTAYSYQHVSLRTEDGSTDTFSTKEIRTPRHQISIRSLMDLSPTVELDLWFRFVDGMADIGVSDYATLDVHLGWNPHPQLELSLVGQNLLQRDHLEYDDPFLIDILPTKVERSVYGKILYRF